MDDADLDTLKIMRGLERRETLGMIDRSHILEQYDSDGSNDNQDNNNSDTDSDTSIKSYNSDQN
jgi:hypothetical protein